MSPQVYIILVNFNSSQDSIQCLESLLRINYSTASIILIDNASTDNSLNVITTWLERESISYSYVTAPEDIGSPTHKLTIIKSPSNLGFGGACNSGISLAMKNGAPLALLLNNDTIVEPYFLDYLVATMQSSKAVGAVGGKICYANDKERIWYCGGRIDFLTCMAYHCTMDRKVEFATRFITGCMMLLSMDAVKKIGGFDERYFFNVEDWDYSQRLKENGWKLMINPRAVIYHKISGSMGGTRTYLNQYFFHRNRLFFLSKHRVGISKFFFLLIQFSVVLPAWSVLQIIRGNYVGLKALFSGLLDFSKKKTGSY